MSKTALSYRDKKLCIWLGVSVVIMIFGFLFLVNAMGIANFYPHFAGIPNALGKYIVVILDMSVGIMLFSNIALRFENDKLRKGLTIGITVFAFILTVPLTYVLISMLPFAATHKSTDILAAAGVSSIGEMTPDKVASSATVLGLNPVDGVMGTHNIYLGFANWFHEGGFLWVVLVFMAILGVIFLIEPLAAGICVCKGKILMLFSKDEKGKFHIFYAKELPVLKARRENEIYERAA